MVKFISQKRKLKTTTKEQVKPEKDDSNILYSLSALNKVEFRHRFKRGKT